MNKFNEPWTFSLSTEEIKDCKGNYILEIEDHGLSWINQNDSFEAIDCVRSVDCVNACAGIDSPSKEIERLRKIELIATQLVREISTTDAYVIDKLKEQLKKLI